MNELKLISPQLMVNSNIALVASSSNLLEREYGKTIDSFDEVVRFNRAPTKGYEKYVGSKTTIRIANNHVFGNVLHSGWDTDAQPTFFIKEQKNINIVHLGPEAVHWGDRSQHIDPSSRAFLVDCNAIQRDIFSLTNERPSAGFGFLFICLISDLHPHIFGYGFGEEGCPHYYEKNSISSHQFVKEREVMKIWIQKGYVTAHL